MGGIFGPAAPRSGQSGEVIRTREGRTVADLPLNISAKYFVFDPEEASALSCRGADCQFRRCLIMVDVWACKMGRQRRCV